MKYAPKPSIKMLPVLAVDRSNIDALFTGIKTIDLSTLGQESFHFVNRSVVDSKNPLHFGIGYAFPQILIYTVIKDVDGRVLSYSRAKGTEDRLSKFNSIGFGGHVDVLDLQVDEQGAPDYIKTLQVAASRELYEELNKYIFRHINTYGNTNKTIEKQASYNALFCTGTRLLLCTRTRSSK